MQPFVYESAVFNLTFHFTQLKRECNRLHKIFSFFFSSHFLNKKTASRRDSLNESSSLIFFTERRIRLMTFKGRVVPVIESCVRFVEDEGVTSVHNIPVRPIDVVVSKTEVEQGPLHFLFAFRDARELLHPVRARFLDFHVSISLDERDVVFIFRDNEHIALVVPLFGQLSTDQSWRRVPPPLDMCLQIDVCSSCLILSRCMVFDRDIGLPDFDHFDFFLTERFVHRFDVFRHLFPDDDFFDDDWALHDEGPFLDDLNP